MAFFPGLYYKLSRPVLRVVVSCVSSFLFTTPYYSTLTTPMATHSWSHSHRSALRVPWFYVVLPPPTTSTAAYNKLSFTKQYSTQSGKTDFCTYSLLCIYLVFAAVMYEVIHLFSFVSRRLFFFSSRLIHVVLNFSQKTKIYLHFLSFFSTLRWCR